MPFNIQSIRDINRVKILVADTQSMPKGSVYSKANTHEKGVTKKVFEAYRPQNPFNLNTEIMFDDPKDTAWGNILSFGANLMGLAPAFDVPRKFSYRGSKPLSFQVPCFLKLETSVKKDFIDPITSLMQLMLPTRGKELGQFIADSAESLGEKLSQWVPMLSGFFGTAADTIGDGATAVTNFLKEYVGTVYMLEMPPAYKMMAGDNGGYTLCMGKLRFDGVIVTSVAMTIPPFLYEDGYPDHISLTLSIQTIRPATSTMFGQFMSGVYGGSHLNTKSGFSKTKTLSV